MAGSKENLKISDKDNKETAKYSETGQNYSEHAHTEWDILKSLISDKNSLVTISTNNEKDID